MERKLLALAIAGLTISNANALTFQVTEENDNGLGDTQGTLSYAIRNANDPNGQPGRENGSAGPDIIDFQSDITITAPMLALIDSDITIQGNGYTLSGGKLHRPLFIKSGTVSISGLTISDGLAKGQNTGWGSGAGAGLGGGLFIYDGEVSLDEVTFRNNRAFGGTGRVRGALSQNGGGMQKTKPESTSSSDLFNNGSHGSSLFGDAGYGHNAELPTTSATGNYGGQLTTTENPNGGFGSAGKSNSSGDNGGHGGFGSGGGAGYAYGTDIGGEGNYACGVAGDGGFGGGGAYGGTSGGKGGFGAGGGSSYYGGNLSGGFGTQSSSFDGAGLGGGIFVRSGSLAIKDSSFESNQAYGGTNHPDIIEHEPILDGPFLKHQAARAIVEPAAGHGGGLFVMHTLENDNGNNQGMPTALPNVTLCNVSFSAIEGKENTAGATFNNTDTAKYFDAAGRLTDSTGSFQFTTGQQLQASVTAGESYEVALPLINCGTQSLSWEVAKAPSKGQALLSQDGTLTFQANSDAEGADSITIAVTSDTETKNLTIDLTINAANNNSSSGGGSLLWLLAGLLPTLRKRR